MKIIYGAPTQVVSWKDAMTEHESTSLGTQQYNELLVASGLSLLEKFEDEGENHYYHAVKV